ISNNSPNHQSQESTESDSEDSTKLNINLGALQKSASNIFHIQYTSIQEFSEGDFHKVYILKMEDSNEYIGRVAFPVYPQWKTECEVAVIEYIRLNTQIPVPKVYYWNSSVNNPDDGNNTFVLTHVDFHTSNILVKNDEITGVIDWECSGAFPVECFCTNPVWITNNPMIEQNNKKSRENIILQKFFRSEMSHRDPDFIRTINNIDEEKKEFYSTVFSQKV
ncbi:18669_t:CDS:2, partial [Racocetra persica]